MDYANTLSGPIDFGWVAKACPSQACLLSVMEKHGPGLVQMLWRVLGNQSDVADAYQETFCRLSMLLHEGKSWDKQGFVYRMAANIAIDMLRRRQREAAARRAFSQIGEPQVDPVSALDRQDELDRLQTAIAELPDHLRQVLLLREFGELDYGAVASALQISSGTARQYRHRALVMLAEKLKGREGK